MDSLTIEQGMSIIMEVFAVTHPIPRLLSFGSTNVGFLPSLPWLTALDNADLFAVSSLVDTEEHASGPFYLLKEQQNIYEGTVTYVPEWVFMDHLQIVDIAREVGICESCYGFGYLEAGLQVEVIAMIMGLYPPTLEIREIKPYDPSVAACASYPTPGPTPYRYPASTLAPTFVPTNSNK